MVDEGHSLKGGASTRRAQALQRLTSHHRVLLTGTPLQNNLAELFNLLHHLDPLKFNSLQDFERDSADLSQEVGPGAYFFDCQIRGCRHVSYRS